MSKDDDRQLQQMQPFYLSFATNCYIQSAINQDFFNPKSKIQNPKLVAKPTGEKPMSATDQNGTHAALKSTDSIG
jgi:hypothetical protein